MRGLTGRRARWRARRRVGVEPTSTVTTTEPVVTVTTVAPFAFGAGRLPAVGAWAPVCTRMFVCGTVFLCLPIVEMGWAC